MYLDAKFDFGLPTIANSTARTASANIYDHGSAAVLFGADAKPCYLWGRATVTADADPTIMVELVASDEADLDPNLNANPLTTEVLASTGIIRTQQDGGVLVSGDTVEFLIPIQLQRIARRYYGGHVVLGGTNPDLAAGQDLRIVLDGQTSLIGARAAVP
jgi:hypothetical protein